MGEKKKPTSKKVTLPDVALARGEAREWFVYLLRCADETLYCGIAKDVARRLEAHRKGKGARYTRGRGPLELLWTLPAPLTWSEALRLERAIKSLPRQRKLAFCHQSQHQYSQ